MRNKLYWGLGILIVLLIGAFVFVMVNQNAQIKQLEVEAKKAQDKANQMKDTPPVAREGYKMVPHGNHWHEVPIDAPDTWQGEPHGEGVTEDDIPIQTYDGPLTYHAELLETNPVKALRLQSEERGHWSAPWIPPFPPDDLEAQTFARNTYLSIYYDDTHPDWEKHAVAQMNQRREIDKKYPYGPRLMDLSKIIWPVIRFRIDHYSPSGVAMKPSDYFPKYESDFKKFGFKK